VYWIKGAIAGTLILVAGHGSSSLRRKNSGIKVTPRGPTFNSPRIDLQMAFVFSTMRPWRVDFVVGEAGRVWWSQVDEMNGEELPRVAAVGSAARNMGPEIRLWRREGENEGGWVRERDGAVAKWVKDVRGRMVNEFGPGRAIME
jgi:hypothetical protein